MPHQIGYVANNGDYASAHYELLKTIKEFAVSCGWQVLRWIEPVNGAGHSEVILKGVGYSGAEEIFVGLATYESVTADYYNLVAATMVGYVPENDFYAQPGGVYSGVPAHNQRIDYWLTVNPQRIAAALKVGTPVYESFYIGKFFPYGRPDQYPYPVVCGGMLNGTPATRFSDATHSIPYAGNRANLKLRNAVGWIQPYGYPWGSPLATAGTLLRDTGGIYTPMPVELHDNTHNLYGFLDGIFYISGFNNVVENTFSYAGHDFVVMQDVWRTGHNSYYALRLDA